VYARRCKLMAVSAAQAIRARARELGFDTVAFARATPLDVDHPRYLAFLAGGYHGEMKYLAENAELRARVDVPELLDGARTVICLARRYVRAEEAARPSLVGTIARYARGRDYHNFVEKRARSLAKFVRRLGEGVGARAFVDSAPVLERAWAAQAGLGFVGKNGLIIVPGQGSFCLLGEVLTTLELEALDYGVPIGERCGSCTACLDACPTEAFVAPFVLDARRCISFQTIERREAPPLAGDFGERLFGCDACQEVCPYNRVAPGGATEPFAPLDRWADATLAVLVGLDDDGFAALTEASPVRRATRKTLAMSALRLARRRLDRDADDVDARAALERGVRHEDASVRAYAETLVAP
jgi:epoxyqueuosine reductase